MWTSAETPNSLTHIKTSVERPLGWVLELIVFAIRVSTTKVAKVKPDNSKTNQHLD